jgi:hypothetical protein
MELDDQGNAVLVVEERGRLGDIVPGEAEGLDDPLIVGDDEGVAPTEFRLIGGIALTIPLRENMGNGAPHHPNAGAVVELRDITPTPVVRSSYTRPRTL